MKLLAIAGEISGDTHGGALIKSLKTMIPALQVHGIGGMAMQAAGLQSIIPFSMLQASGVVESVRHIPRLLSILNQLKQWIEAEQPTALLLIDYPGFNLKLAAYAKQKGIPVLWYSSPQIWASRRGRLKTILQAVDTMVVLFPFEETLYAQHGMQAHYFGHPLAVEASTQQPTESIHTKLGIATNVPLLALAPGSRSTEINTHLPILLKTLQCLRQKGYEAHGVIPFNTQMQAHIDLVEIEKWIVQHALQAHVSIVRDQFMQVMHAADLALVAAGTAVLQTALTITPMVVGYKTSWLSAWIARRLMYQPYVAMVNIIAQREVVPERLQEQFYPKSLAQAVLEVVQDSKKKHQMVAELTAIRDSLQQGDAYQKAASCFAERLLAI